MLSTISAGFVWRCPLLSWRRIRCFTSLQAYTFSLFTVALELARKRIAIVIGRLGQRLYKFLNSFAAGVSKTFGAALVRGVEDTS